MTYAKLSQVPTKLLTSNLVHSLIMAKGVINLWDALLERFITDLRKEHTERVDELLDANNRFEARARAAERVCKAIAATDPSWLPSNGIDPECFFCETPTPEDVGSHLETCLWLRAKGIAEAPK